MSATACYCVWPQTCGGQGILMCRYCGGDFCICRCGGEMDCQGCEDCEDPRDDSDDGDDWTEEAP